MKAPTRQDAPQVSEDAKEPQESLSKRFARAKARWLRRAMYSAAKPIERNFAFVIADHANCVTEDAWPGQDTIARLLCCSTKTVRRAMEALENLQLLAVRRSSIRGASPRYSPVFIPDDWDTDGQDLRHPWSVKVDRDVQQSSSSIHISSPSPTRGRANEIKVKQTSDYRRSQRGKWEAELSKWLGPDGLEILGKLSMISDGIVENLCRAACNGEVGPRELEAARLAAKQLPASWTRSWGDIRLSLIAQAKGEAQ
jgi:hypothetical protein